MKKRIWSISFIAVCSILIIIASLVPGCAVKTPSEKEPIKIGVLLGLTGPVSAYYPKFKQGIELAVNNDFNGEVAGRPILLIYEDHAGDTTVALEKAKKLIGVDKVSAILGPEFDGLPPVVGEYASQQKVPTFNWKGYLVDTMPKFDYQFTLAWTQYTATMPLAAYAANVLHNKNASLLLADYVAGYGFADAFKAEFEKDGGQVIQEQYAPIGTADFSSYLTSIKQADVVGMWSISPDIGLMLKQYAEFGLTSKFGTPLVVLGSSLWPEEMGTIGEPILGAVSVNDYTPLIQSTANDEFLAKFQKVYGSRPTDGEAEVAYEGTTMLLEAIQKMGGTTPPEQLRQTLLDLKEQLPSGPVSFTQQGWPVHNMYLVKAAIVNGVYLWQPIPDQIYYLDPTTGQPLSGQ